MNKTKIYVAVVNELNNQKTYRDFYETVSAYRKQKIDRLNRQKDKILSLGAEILLRKVLEENGIGGYEITVSGCGKPYIKDCNVFFSLSHSGDMVMCAISQNEVGCDIQKIKEVDLRLAERFYSKEEYETVMRETDEFKKQDMFLRIWTLKESLIKVAGRGVQIPFSELKTDISKNTVSFLDKKYYFKEYKFNSLYRLAVCCTSDGFDDIKEIQIK